MIKTNTAQRLREAAARLIKQAKELEAGIDRSKCEHGIYTDIPFKGCKTCGDTVRVKCKFQKVGFVNSGKCRKETCPDFETLKLKS